MINHYYSSLQKRNACYQLAVTSGLKNLTFKICYKALAISICLIGCKVDHPTQSNFLKLKPCLSDSSNFVSNLEPIIGASWELHCYKPSTYKLIIYEDILSMPEYQRSSDSLYIHLDFDQCTHLVKHDIYKELVDYNKLIVKTFNFNDTNSIYIHSYQDTLGDGIVFNYMKVEEDCVFITSGGIHLKKFNLLIKFYFDYDNSYSSNVLGELYCFLKSINIINAGLKQPNCLNRFRNEKEYLEYISGPNNIYNDSLK